MRLQFKTQTTIDGRVYSPGDIGDVASDDAARDAVARGIAVEAPPASPDEAATPLIEPSVPPTGEAKGAKRK